MNAISKMIKDDLYIFPIGKEVLMNRISFPRPGVRFSCEVQSDGLFINYATC